MTISPQQVSMILQGSAHARARGGSDVVDHAPNDLAFICIVGRYGFATVAIGAGAWWIRLRVVLLFGDRGGSRSGGYNAKWRRSRVGGEGNGEPRVRTGHVSILGGAIRVNTIAKEERNWDVCSTLEGEAGMYACMQIPHNTKKL